MDQSDIDALMNEGPDPEDQGAAETPAADSGELTQADIDAALAGGTPEPSPPQEVSEGPAFSDEGGFSQADIDALMAGTDPTADVSAPAEAAPAAEAPAASAEPALDSLGKPMDEFAAAMAAAIEEEQAENPSLEAAAASQLATEEVELPSFDSADVMSEMTQPISLLHDVELHVKVELGRTNLFVEDVLRLGEGSVVELDRLAGDPVDVFVNSRLVARGEVLVLNDNFCVRISEIVSGPSTRMVG